MLKDISSFPRSNLIHTYTPRTDVPVVLNANGESCQIMSITAPFPGTQSMEKNFFFPISTFPVDALHTLGFEKKKKKVIFILGV